MIATKLTKLNHTYEDQNEFIKVNNVKLEKYTYKKLNNLGIDELKTEALNDYHCLGFSSDGMMKFYTPIDKIEYDNTCRFDLYIHKTRYEYYLTQNNTNIPKKIHFIWFKNGRPFNLLNFIAIKAALYHNPEYDVIFHCDNIPNDDNIYFNNLKKESKMTINAIVEPQHINNKPVKHFQHKADYVRLNILKDMGGIYLDTDFILLKPLDKFLKNKFVMGYERPNDDNYLCNACIMVEPNNIIIKEWLHIYNSSWSESFVPSWMGHSVMIPAQLYEKYGYMMTICDNTTFYPFLWDDFSILYQKDNNNTYSDSVGMHLWDTELSKTKLLPNNPEYFLNNKNAFVRLFKKHVEELLLLPDDNIDNNFSIYPGQDSLNYDIKCHGRKSIEELKKICIDDSMCVGFNTIGFMKHKIDTNNLVNFSTVKFANCTSQDGLYVHKARYDSQ